MLEGRVCVIQIASAIANGKERGLAQAGNVNMTMHIQNDTESEGEGYMYNARKRMVYT